ncbi:hypothetical protein AVEN_160635-1, partial [Araneus ventricosus]
MFGVHVTDQNCGIVHLDMAFGVNGGLRVTSKGIYVEEEIAMDEEKENHTRESDNEIMPKQNRKIRLIPDFLIPSLNDRRFGERLRWINEEEGKLQMLWPHKNSSKWKTEQTAVFQGWDAMKGRKVADGAAYYTASKHRMSRALQKLSKSSRPALRELPSPDAKYKCFQLLGRWR